MASALTVSVSPKSVMTINRRAVRCQKVVYLICTPKPKRYARRRSRIVYIGTTQAGIRRFAKSAAQKAVDYLEQRGVRWLDVYVVKCSPRSGRASWSDLERDLLIMFRNEYGGVPAANRTGHRLALKRYSGAFKDDRLKKVLAVFDHSEPLGTTRKPSSRK